MEKWVVVCHWYHDVEVNIFDTFKEAYKYMEKDWKSAIIAQNWEIRGEEVYDDSGDNVSDGTWISDGCASFYRDDFGISDRLLWNIEKITI